jgi:hypothetical protein
VSAMVSQLLAGSPLLVFPVVALVIFIVVFAVAVTRVMRRPAKAYEALAKMPLEVEGEQHE